MFSPACSWFAAYKDPADTTDLQVQLGAVKTFTASDSNITFTQLARQNYDSITYQMRGHTVCVVYNWDQVCTVSVRNSNELIDFVSHRVSLIVLQHLDPLNTGA